MVLFAQQSFSQVLEEADAEVEQVQGCGQQQDTHCETDDTNGDNYNRPEYPINVQERKQKWAGNEPKTDPQQDAQNGEGNDPQRKLDEQVGNPDRIQVQLLRDGNAGGTPLRITKGLTIDAGSHTLQIAYLLENLPQNHPLHFAVEFNFAGMPSNAYGRNFSDIDGKILGQLGTKLDLSDALGLTLTDEWLGLDVGVKMSRPTSFWTFPIETVSQSEGGFELVHQSVVVQPHWLVQADEQGRWSVVMRLAIDTGAAESRRHDHSAVAVTS
jgi:hypothetical protein